MGVATRQIHELTNLCLQLIEVIEEFACEDTETYKRLLNDILGFDLYELEKP